MNEKLQLVWIFTVLIESLNEWLLLYWLNYGLDWNGLERWSSMIWPLLKDADSVSDGRRRLKSIQSAFLIFCILQGGTQMWRRRKSNILGSLNDTNEHLNILRAEISTQLEGPSKSHELAWKWFRETKLSSESCGLSCLARFGFFVRPTFLINIYCSSNLIASYLQGLVTANGQGRNHDCKWFSLFVDCPLPSFW